MRLGHHPLALLSAEEVWGGRRERSRMRGRGGEGERGREEGGGRGAEEEGVGERGSKKDFILL